MAWTASLRNKLSQSDIGEPIWYVFTVNAPFLPVPGASLASTDLPFATYTALANNVTIPGEGVDPYTWNTTHGAWSFEVAGLDPSVFATFFRRGYLAWMFLGFPEFASSEYGSVALGLIQQVESLGPDKYRVSVTGLGGMLGSRLDPNSDVSSLFYNLPASTALTADFDPTTDTSISVSSTTGLERQTGGSYLVQIVTSETDGSGNTYAPFYVLCSAKSATTLTPATTGPVPGALNTTARQSYTGDTVNFLAYVAGDHPIDIALKVLTSTGTGTNGTYDTLPKSWGVGLPQSVFDFPDIARSRNEVDPTVWNSAAVLLATDAQPDPGAWLSNWLAGMGIFITMRQGEITIRAANLPNNMVFQQSGIDVGEWIEWGVTPTHLWYDPSYPVEYIKTLTIDEAVTQSNTRQEAPSNTLPAGDSLTYTVPAYSNITNALIEVNERIGPWATRIPERMEFTTSGWYCAQLGPGEGALLTTDRTRGQFGLGNKFRVYILEVSPVMIPGGDFSTRITCSLLPPTAN